MEPTPNTTARSDGDYISGRVQTLWSVRGTSHDARDTLIILFKSYQLALYIFISFHNENFRNNSIVLFQMLHFLPVPS